MCFLHASFAYFYLTLSVRVNLTLHVLGLFD